MARGGEIEQFVDRQTANLAAQTHSYYTDRGIAHQVAEQPPALETAIADDAGRPHVREMAPTLIINPPQMPGDDGPPVEHTLLLVKPEGLRLGVDKSLVVQHLAPRGLRVVYQSPIQQLTPDAVVALYGDAPDWDKLEPLVMAQMLSGPSQLMVVQGPDAIRTVKEEIVGCQDLVRGSIRRELLDRMARDHTVRAEIRWSTGDANGMRIRPTVYNGVHATRHHEVQEHWEVLHPLAQTQWGGKFPHPSRRPASRHARNAARP